MDNRFSVQKEACVCLALPFFQTEVIHADSGFW
jgi:hypothetical protein